MVKGITIQVAARVPLSVVEFMDKDIALNNFHEPCGMGAVCLSGIYENTSKRTG